MPLFAFANAGVVFSSESIMTPVAMAVMVGLVIGKPDLQQARQNG